MFTITLTVCEEQEVEDVLHALSEAEEEGLITFPFQTQVREMSLAETRSWKDTTVARIRNPEADQFENEGRN